MGFIKSSLLRFIRAVRWKFKIGFEIREEVVDRKGDTIEEKVDMYKNDKSEWQIHCEITENLETNSIYWYDTIREEKVKEIRKEVDYAPDRYTLLFRGILISVELNNKFHDIQNVTPILRVMKTEDLIDGKEEVGYTEYDFNKVTPVVGKYTVTDRNKEIGYEVYREKFEIELDELTNEMLERARVK